MGNVRIGIGMDPIHPPRDVLAYADLAEELGYSSLWIADSQFLMREAYVLMGAAAMRTHRMVIGPGITNPITRDLSVIAGAFSTLDEMAPGRIVLAFGVGDSAVRLLGRNPATAAEMEAAIITVRRLLQGEPVQYGDQSVALRAPRPVPIYLAATGPKLLQVAARVADGVLLGFLTDAGQIGAARELIAAEAARVGRDLGGFRFVGWMPCCVDPDAVTAREAVRVHVARHVLHRFPAQTDIDAAVVDRLRGAYDYREHMIPGARHAGAVPLDLVDRFALAGTPAEVVVQTRRLLQTGVDELVIVPRGDKVSIIRSFALDVLPHL